MSSKKFEGCDNPKLAMVSRGASVDERGSADSSVAGATTRSASALATVDGVVFLIILDFFAGSPSVVLGFSSSVAFGIEAFFSDPFVALVSGLLEFATPLEPSLDLIGVLTVAVFCNMNVCIAEFLQASNSFCVHVWFSANFVATWVMRSTHCTFTSFSSQCRACGFTWQTCWYFVSSFFLW